MGDRIGPRPFALTAPQTYAQLFPRDVQDTAQAVGQRLVKEALEHHISSWDAFRKTHDDALLALRCWKRQLGSRGAARLQGFAQGAAGAAVTQHYVWITDPK